MSDRDRLVEAMLGRPSMRPPFLAGTTTNTQLPFLGEMEFRQWAKDNRVPFDPEAASSDYDMRGFWQASRRGDPLASTALNPNDQRIHYSDFWKTPEHRTFSNESQWATPQTPGWSGDKLVTPYGRVVFDETAAPEYPWERR
jgi:hypothetical protein